MYVSARVSVCAVSVELQLHKGDGLARIPVCNSRACLSPWCREMRCGKQESMR